MRALRYHEYGDPEVLVVDEIDEPHAGPGQIRIKVVAASVNPLDTKLRRGLMAGDEPLAEPQQLGFDAAGVVDEVGEDVGDVAVGDDVFGLGSRTNAEYAVLRVWAKKPASLDWAVAGAAGSVAETAARALGLLGVGAGSTVLIDGAAGGVGSVATQLAVARGATVIGTAGQDNQDYLREIGASPVLYGDGMPVRARLVDEDIDAVLDTAGKTPLAELVALAPEASQVVTIANFDVAGTGVRLTTGDADGDPWAALAEAAQLLEQSKIVIKVQTFPLDRAPEAHRIVDTGHGRGKIVLLP
jgi:NADPH:quinone reductase-like Zn-dependent oxidoreductase